MTAHCGLVGISLMASDVGHFLCLFFFFNDKMHLKFTCKVNEKIILKHSETGIFQALKRALKLRNSVVGSQAGRGRAARAPGNSSRHSDAHGTDAREDGLSSW